MRAFIANPDRATASDLDGMTIVVCMTGNELAKLRAALQLLLETAEGKLHTELMPLCAALSELHA